MFEIRDNIKYTDDHEWVAVNGSKAKFGIDDYSQHEMGDLVYIEIPAVGTHVSKDEEIGAMESVKSVEPIYAPVSGTVIEVNGQLVNDPGAVNLSPYDEGWLAVIEMDDASEIDTLMDSEKYRLKLDRQ